MKIHSIRQVLKIAAFVTFFWVTFFTNSGLFNLPSAMAATSDLSGHAWSEKIGWISFSGNASDGSPYSVKVDTTNKSSGGTGGFSGHAWSSNVGWISFNRAETGNPPSTPFNSGSGSIAQINWTGGKVTGWARTINGMNTGGWDGWIKLSDDSVSVWQNKGVIFSNPNFTSAFSGYAWEPDTIGWIDFGPTITTTAGTVFVGVKLGGVSAGNAPVVVADVTVGGISATQVSSGLPFVLTMDSFNSPTSCVWSRVSDKPADDFGTPTPVSLGAGIVSYSSTNSWTGPLSVTWTFTCTNTYGSATDLVTLTIGSPANTPPVANAGANQTIVLPMSSTTLIGTASDSNGTITGTVWTKVAGPTGGTITNPTALSTSITGLANQGTYVFRLTVTDNDGLIGSDDTQLVVAPTTLPDLTAGAISPTNATVNVATTFSSTIINLGSVSTNAGFPNFFQVSDTANGAGPYTDLVSSTMTTLASGATANTSKAYTFTTAGTYSVRACADKTSSSDTGSISEASETNNCGAWTDVTVGNNLQAPTGAIFGPTQGVPGTYTFTVTAIDPQNDAIRYGVDWNMDGTADEWLPIDTPVVQYVSSGTPQDFTHTWATNGTQLFQVIVQDTGGNGSWIQYNIVISDIAPTVPIYITPVAQNITSGTETVIIWNIDPTVYTTSTCVASDTSGGSWPVNSASYFSPTGTLLDGTTTYTITCTNNTDPTVVVTNSTTVTVSQATGGSTCNYDTICGTGESIASCPTDCTSPIKQN